MRKNRLVWFVVLLLGSLSGTRAATVTQIVPYTMQPGFFLDQPSITLTRSSPEGCILSATIGPPQTISPRSKDKEAPASYLSYDIKVIKNSPLCTGYIQLTGSAWKTDPFSQEGINVDIFVPIDHSVKTKLKVALGRAKDALTPTTENKAK